MSIVHGPHRMAIYQSRGALYKAAWPALLGGLAGIPVLLYWQRKKRVFKAASIITGILLPVWETQFVPAVSRLMFPRPLLSVTDQGIDYRPMSPWYLTLRMSMRWEEMAAMYVDELTVRGKKRTVTHRLLCILPKDQETFLRQHKLVSPRRLLLLVVMSRTGSPFLIPERLVLPHTLDGILSQICQHFEAYIQANQVEIRAPQKESIE